MIRLNNPTTLAVLLIVFIIIYPVRAPGQTNIGALKYKLAQNYENSGDYETAVKFYQDAYTSDSSSPVYLDALKRCHLLLKNYDRAISLLQNWLDRNPGDLNIFAQIGSVYALKSDDSSAMQSWERAIAIAPQNEITYRIVGNAMIQSRLFDQAIALYKRGRIACNNDALFGDDIARLYSIMLNYADATREYLKILRQTPAQLGYIQSNIAIYTGRADGLSSAISIVQEESKAEPANAVFHQLLAWLYMEGKQFDRAYVVYKTLDDLLLSGGRELFYFAERALREKSYDVSRQAYLEILHRYPNFELLPQVKFGYARSLEESVSSPDSLMIGLKTQLAEQARSEDAARFDSSLAAYQRVIIEHSTTEFAARALLRTAYIRRVKFFDRESARSALESLIKIYTRFRPLVLDAKFQLGDVYISSGDLAKAEQEFNTLANDASIDNSQREKAAFRLAEIDYFRTRFPESLQRLETLSRNPSSDVTNDALDLKLFIRENLTLPDSAMHEYAHAEFINRQHRYPEALDMFRSIITHYPKSALADDALLNIGHIYTVMGRYADAVQTYTKISTDYPESIFLDQVLMRTGMLYQFGLRDTGRAIASYQQLLEKYPDSVFINEARKRARELRGDTL